MMAGDMRGGAPRCAGLVRVASIAVVPVNPVPDVVCAVRVIVHQHVGNGGAIPPRLLLQAAEVADHLGSCWQCFVIWKLVYS